MLDLRDMPGFMPAGETDNFVWYSYHHEDYLGSAVDVGVSKTMLGKVRIGNRWSPDNLLDILTIALCYLEQYKHYGSGRNW